VSTERIVQIVEQHRALLERVDALFGRLTGDSEEARRRRLERDLVELLRALEEHFIVEASSTLLLTREQLAASKHAEIVELDAEHPRLLNEFQEVLRALEARTTTVEEVQRLAVRAASHFRAHEEREDALFRADSE
jgi:hemerythrin